MSRIQLFPLCALAVAICASSVRSEEAGDYYAANSQFASYSTVASMSQQMAELEARLASFEKGGCDTGCGAAAPCGCDGGCDAGCDGGCGGGCDGGCGDGCWDSWVNPGCGLTGTAEVVWLRMQDSEPDSGFNDFQHGSRWTVGYVNSCGREWRIRYFELGLNSPIDDFHNYWTVDLEYAGRFQLGHNWAGEISLGARYADFHEEGDLNYVDTIGPVIGLHLKSDQIAWDTGLFTNLRYSHQFGHALGETLGSFSITELQAGLEWSRELCAGTAFLRGFFEAQKWAGVDDNSSEDQGLIGFGLALGFTR